MAKLSIAPTQSKAAQFQGSRLSPTLKGQGPSRVGTSINPNAANVQYSPAPIPTAVPNQVGKAVQDFGASLMNSVQVLGERQDGILADEAKMEFNDFARNHFYGTEDEGGYAKSSGIDTLQGYSGYTSSLTAKYEEITGRLEPSVKQRAIVHMHDTLNRYSVKGATHRAKQTEVTEAQAQVMKRNDIIQTLRMEGHTAWQPTGPNNSSAVTQHLNGIVDPTERFAAADYFATFTMQEAYNNSMPTDDPYTGYNDAVVAARSALSAVDSAGVPLVSAEHRQSIEYRLLQYRDKADTHLKKTKAVKEAKAKSEYTKTAPPNIAAFLAEGKPELAMSYTNNLRQLYKNDPEKGSKEVMDALAASLDIVANSDPRFVTVEAKMGEVNTAVALIESSKEFATFDTAEIVSFNNIISDLEVSVIRAQDSKDKVGASSLAALLESEQGADVNMADFKAPEGTLVENLPAYDKILMNHTDNKANGIKAEDLVARDQSETYYMGKVEAGSFDSEDKDRMFQMVLDNQMSGTTYSSIVRMSEDYRKPGTAKPKTTLILLYHLVGLRN